MVLQASQTAQAGPSSSKAPSSAAKDASSEAFISFRDIYDHLELARHQRGTDELEALLRSNKRRLQRCADPYAKPSDASKRKLAAASVTLGSGASIKLDDQQRELAKTIAQRYDLDEIDSLVLLRTFLDSEDRSLELLSRPSASADGSASRAASVAPSAGLGRSTSLLAASVKGKASAAGSDDVVSDFLDAFNVFYFEERLYILRTVCSLFRIAEDPSHELYDLACDVLVLFADEAFGLACLDDFESMVAEPLPDHVREQPRYSGFWAKQRLKEQLGLLEVVFLLLYGRIQASPTLIVRILQTLHNTDAGRQQANGGFFDNEAVELVTCIGHLLVLIGVESLALEEAMDGIDLHSSMSSSVAANRSSVNSNHQNPYSNGASGNRLVEDPAKLGEALDLLEQTGHDPSRSPVLLAWSLVLNRIDDALAAAADEQQHHEQQQMQQQAPASDNPGDEPQARPAAPSSSRLPAHIAALADVVRIDDGGPPVWRRLAQAAFAPELSLFAAMVSILASPLLATSNSTAALAVSAPSALAYRAVFKGLLLSVTELIKPEFLPDFDALVALWEAAFGSGVATELSPTALEGIAALCVQFWEIDAHHDSRCATIDTARRRWPVSFRPLLRLVKALTGNARPDALESWPSSLQAGARSPPVEQACAAAFQFLAQVPTFAQVLPNLIGGPYEAVDGGDYVSVSYRVTRPVQVAGTHVRLPAGITGSAISEIGATPVIVLWTPTTPISAWKLMRDILLGFPPYLSSAGYDGNGGGGDDSRVFDDDSNGVDGDRPGAATAADFSKLAPVNADDPWEEVAAEALELFASVLSASSKLAWSLLAHLDGDDRALTSLRHGGDLDGDSAMGAISGARQPRQPGRSRDLAAVAIHLLQHTLVGTPIDSRLVDVAYKLLSILLPYMPNEIWQTVRSSNLLTGSPGSLSYVSRASSDAATIASASASTPSVLLAHETSRASYPGLLSLLDFLAALVLEMRRSHFVSTADLLEVKASVLLRGLAWVFESVWPEYQSWRYVRLRDKLEIGRRCTALFRLVLSETSWKVSSQPSAEGFERRGPASSLVDALERALVTAPSMLSLAPLVSALGSGQQLVDQLHRAGCSSDAALAEDYVLASLQLATLIVSRRRDLVSAAAAAAAASRSAPQAKAAAAPRVELGLLERLFFDHAAVAMRSVSGGGRKSARVELASAVMSYVLLPISATLSAEASRLITAVCRSTADVAAHGQPVPGLVGHLGTIAELESTVAGLVNLVGNTYLDASLRADVWTMLAAIVDTQPALATLLLTGRHLAKTTEFQLTEARDDGVDNAAKNAGNAEDNRASKVFTVSSSYGQALDRTALEVASDAVLIGAELLRNDPALLESILRFLDIAWTHAAEHSAAFEPVRTRTDFFRALADLATAEADAPPGIPEGFVFEDGARRTDSDVDAREYAHRRMCQARALRLLECDIQLGGIVGGGSGGDRNRNRQQGEAASLSTMLSLLSDGDKLRSALEASFKTYCDPALQYESERKLAELFPTVHLAALRHPARRDDFDSGRRYGDDYVFDVAALRRKLEGFFETLSDDDVADLESLEEGVLAVATINLEWTALDVQATMIRAWTQSLRSAMGRLVTAAVAKGTADKLQDALMSAWTACARIAVDETLESDVMRGIHAARVELLSVVIETAWGRRDAGQKVQGERIVEVSELAARLLGHSIFSIEDSIQGLVSPPFHRACFDVAVFSAVQCRRWLQGQDGGAAAAAALAASTTSTDGSSGVEVHRALHRAMDAFARHTIASLRISMTNCLVCIQRGQAATDQARSLEDDLDLLVSLFELVIRTDVGLVPHAWLAQVQSERLFQVAIDLLGRAPVLRFDGTARDGSLMGAAASSSPSPNSAHHPLFITPVLSLLLALSSHPGSSEQLALAGVVNGLASNMLSQPLEAGAVSPLLLGGSGGSLGSAGGGGGAAAAAAGAAARGDAGQRTGAGARFIETDVDGFVRVYARQIESALAFAPIYALDGQASSGLGGFGTSLSAAAASFSGSGTDRDAIQAAQAASPSSSIVSLPGLDELELICRLFYSMVRAERDGSSSRNQAGNRHSITAKLSSRLAWLLQPLVHLLQHPRELQSLLGLDAEAEDARAKPLHATAQAKLLDTVTVLVAGLWYQSEAAFVLCREVQAWPSVRSPSALIRPVMRTSPTSAASLGTLLDLAGHLTDHLRGASSSSTSSSSSTTARTASICDALEQTLALCATQAAVWALSPSTGATGAGHRGEVEAGLSRDLTAAIRAAESAINAASSTASATASASAAATGGRKMPSSLLSGASRGADRKTEQAQAQPVSGASLLPVVARFVESRLDRRAF
ncbi:uncharacterized protein PFL1_02114 [Pseudozyma flocculosa PF-1]|uniref:uncharacterized protein n=1 Tax=Pseudozyma flocculosa PF-1 TaxID=1277687 RepID=UPI0004561723|nr:uncharacterized protein PFL1_02114 [Pseudozyma flocculosa PF-1]EPQ30590.1 hypothetical protein PFL1_02114 [Pseudozyma flocculosa PF-1]